MPDLEIRLAEADDAVLAALLRRAWTEENRGTTIADPGYETRFAAWWDEEVGRRTTWLAFLDGLPVGMVNVAEFVRMPRPGVRSGRWGYLANVFVLSAHRGGGIGAALLETAIAAARDRGYVRLVLSPSERSVTLYRRAGFRDANELMILPLTGESVDIPT